MKQDNGEKCMELNHEYQNLYIRGIIHAINCAIDNNGISTIEFEDIVYRTAGDPDHRIGREFLEAIMDSVLFDHSEKYILNPRIPVKLSFLPTNAELQWLCAALHSPAAGLFFDDAELEQLHSVLHNVKKPEIMRHIEIYGFAEPEIPDRNTFRTIIHAIRSHRYLCMTNRAQNGTVYADQTVIPMKLVYDAASGKWFLSFCTPDGTRPIKAYLGSLSDVSAGEAIPPETQPDLQKMMQSKRAEPVVLRVSPENNTPSRAIRYFSQYDTTAVKEADGSLRMEIQYYVFDEETLLRGIISFGRFVQVLSPEHMVQKMCAFLQKYPY